MQNKSDGRPAFLYLAGVTLVSVVLIALNALLGLHIPFTVHFLIGYVTALLVFVVWHAVLTKGWRRSLLMLALSFVVAFTAEALGVNFGLVFGHYYYTPMLGVQLFGVPLLAALAWEPIVYAAFCMTELILQLVGLQARQHPGWPSMIWMAVAGALATTAWDMMIDPIAVSQGWWVWAEGGPYVPYVANGVPIQNFLGWLGVAFVIHLLYRRLANQEPRRANLPYLTLYGPLMLYASLFLTSFGVTLTVLDRPEVALIGLLAMGPFVAIGLANVAAAPVKARAFATGD